MPTTLNEILTNLLGQYQPVVTQLSDQTEIVSINWSYITAAVVFCIVLYSVFRIIGSLFSNV